jgi:hypothetical protein
MEYSIEISLIKFGSSIEMLLAGMHIQIRRLTDSKAFPKLTFIFLKLRKLR